MNISLLSNFLKIMHVHHVPNSSNILYVEKSSALLLYNKLSISLYFSSYYNYNSPSILLK